MIQNIPLILIINILVYSILVTILQMYAKLFLVFIVKISILLGIYEALTIDKIWLL